MLTPSAVTAEIRPMLRMASELFHDPEKSAFETVPSSTKSTARTANSSGPRSGLAEVSAWREEDIGGSAGQ